MNSSRIPTTRGSENSPRFCPRWREFLAVIVLALLFAATPSRAQTLNYSTDWLGNTFSGTNNSHVPNGIDAIAVTSTGTIYANCWYDEAGGEVSVFSPTPAWVNFNGYLHGYSRSGGYAIAMNSTYMYVACSQGESGNNPQTTGSNAGQPLNNGNGLAEYPVNNTGTTGSYSPVTGNYWDCIRRYTLATGAVSAIPTYGYSSDESMIIVSTTENDSQIGTGTGHNPDQASIGTSAPVLGIAANSNNVWVSDNANNKVHVYNASTMAPVATWSITAPGKMVLDPNTNILWIVQNAGNSASSTIQGYDATVPGTATTKGGSITCGTGQHTGAANALAIDASDRLVVADNGVFPETISEGAAAPYVMYPKPDVAQIEVYTLGASPAYSYTFGASVFSGTTPGKVAAQSFHGLTSLAFDASGNFYVSGIGDPHDVGSGTYLRRFNSDATSATQTWQITGLQFVAGGSLDPANLNQFYSSYSGYAMNWANNPLTGTGTGIAATWNMDLFNPGLYPTDKTTTDLTSDWLVPGNGGDNAPINENHPLVFEVRDIQGKPYLFTDAMNMGDFLGVMRMSGNVAVPAVLIGYCRNSWPSDAGKGNCFYWNDANGDGCMQSSEFTAAAGNTDNPLGITLCGKWIDDNANIWSCVRVTSGTGLGEIVEMKLNSTTPVNSYGVPQYNFTSPVDTWVAGANNVTTDTDWTGLVEVAYLPSSDTMIVAGNTSTHTSGATNVYEVVRCYNHWSTATTANKVAHAWEADGTLWKGFYAAGSYVFASQGVNNVNAISVYSLATGTYEGKFTPGSVSPTGLNDEDNPINVRVLADGTYAVFQENDLTNNNTIYRWSPPNAGDFSTTNVLDTNAHTLVQATSTLTANQTNQTAFASAMTTAYGSGFGGVIEFNISGETLTSAPAMGAQYGSGAKTLSIGLTTNSALAISPLQPSSGPTGATNCLSAPNGTSDPNLGDETFTMGTITGGVAGEQVTQFSFTYLTQTVLNGLTVTAVATFSDGTTSTSTQTINRNTSSPVYDTFFGFVAPSGKYITSVALTSNTTRGNTTNIDDVAFITSVP
jgi:hypothetical protein